MYRAPVKDLRFVLRELIGEQTLQACPPYRDYSLETAEAVLEEAGRFAETVLEPLYKSGDREGSRWTPEGVITPKGFKEAYHQFVEAGWPALGAAPDYGGQGVPAVLATAVQEFWAGANLAFKLCPMLTQGAIEAIERHGTQAQKDAFLAKMISGEWTGTMNLTEPQAGSDLAQVRTRAVPIGADRYRLFGQKIFITWGEHDFTSNIVHLVLARIDGAPPGVKGISLFIVPKFLVGADGSIGARNDVQCLSIEHKLGIHASPTCVIAFGQQDGAEGYLVGEANRGLEYMFVMMNAARLSVGLEGYAMAERATQQAIEWARTRVQGKPPPAAASTLGSATAAAMALGTGASGGSTKSAGASAAASSVTTSATAAATPVASAPNRGPSVAPTPAPIVHHPDVKRMLLTMRAQTDAMRALALYAAWSLDVGAAHPDDALRTQAQARGDLLIPIVKAWSTETGVEITSLGIQVHGGMGYVEETGAAQLLRDVRITTIYEGTTGIQSNDLVGRKIARDRGATMAALLAQAQTELAALGSEDPQLLAVRESIQSAIFDLESSTRRIVEAMGSAPAEALAVSVPYLKQCGLTLGGWLLLRLADAATRRLAAGDPDREFLAGKIASTRFYAAQLLPQAAALARVVQGGARSVTEFDAALL